MLSLDKRRFTPGLFRLVLAAAASILFCTGSASAAPGSAPRLSLPIACKLGLDCWIVNYVDVDPAKRKAEDYKCGRHTYDGHKGTDFAVRDWDSMERGVDVLAAAPGRVMRTRDYMRDMQSTEEQRRRMLAENRGCGNGVLMDNGNGWHTIYCHMKLGSIVVKPGEVVKRGQKLGQVGQSGDAAFPHLHLGVSVGGQLVDPFTGVHGRHGCEQHGTPLWAKGQEPKYQPVSLYAAGFSTTRPRMEKLERDASSPRTIPANAPALAFWVTLFNVAKGDRIHMAITGPNGKPYSERNMVQGRDRARQLYFIGKRDTGGKIAEGTYTGIMTVVGKLKDGSGFKQEISRQVSVGS